MYPQSSNPMLQEARRTIAAFYGSAMTADAMLMDALIFELYPQTE